jgi:hypothetical protein
MTSRVCPVRVGDVGGYDGSERGGSVIGDVTAPTAFATVVNSSAPTGFAAGRTSRGCPVRVGDVGGYDGSESGGSVTGDVTAPPHSPLS